MSTPVDGYKTYIFLGAGFIACVLRSRFAVEVPEEVVIGLFMLAGVALRQSIARATNRKG